MLSVDEAQARVLDEIAVLGSERVPLAEAYRRVLAEEVRADVDVPPFANSQMDGYAVRAADTRAATPGTPARLHVQGDLPAGRVADTPLEPGGAYRIMTGAAAPDGADAVVMVEETRTDGDYVLVWREARVGEFVRLRGEDVRAGDLLLSSGTRLGPAHLGAAALAGRAEISAYRVPSVAVITTGDEVVDPAEPLTPGKIRNSNRYALLGQVAEAGARVYGAWHVADDPRALREALVAAAGADFIVASGGVSVGDYDYVKEALAGEGEVAFWRVAMKPGKPFAFGRVRGKPIFGLPGNPVSSMVTFELFARPALRKAMGCAALFRPRVPATLTEPVPHDPGRREFVRAITTPTPAGHETRPTGEQGSGILTSMLRANSLMIVPEEREGIAAGEALEVLLLSSGRDE